jgi:hypothetical protein
LRVLAPTALALALAACGGSSGTSAPTLTARTTLTTAGTDTAPTSAPHARARAAPTAPRERSYTLAPTSYAGVFALSASTRAGGSRLRVLGSKGEICWRFAPTLAVEPPVSAAIVAASAAQLEQVILSLGPRYKSAGCLSAPQALVDGLLSSPGAYYLALEKTGP